MRRPSETTRSSYQLSAFSQASSTRSKCSSWTGIGLTASVWLHSLSMRTNNSTLKLGSKQIFVTQYFLALTNLTWWPLWNCPVKPRLIGLSLQTTLSTKMLTRTSEQSSNTSALEQPCSSGTLPAQFLPVRSKFYSRNLALRLHTDIQSLPDNLSTVNASAKDNPN